MQVWVKKNFDIFLNDLIEKIKTETNCYAGTVTANLKQQDMVKKNVHCAAIGML